MKNFTGMLLALGLASAANAAVIVNYDHTAGAATPLYTEDGVTSSVSLDGTGLFGDVATTIDQYSVAVANGLVLNEDDSFDHYFSYDVSVSASTTFESVAIDTATKSTSRYFQVSYIINSGNEVFLTDGWQTPGSITDDTRDAITYDFEDFTTTADVEFRVYWGGTASSSAEGRVYVDDFVLNGSLTAIPEPTVMAMLGLSGFAFLVVRKFIA
jgi:hypothetical protein